MASIGGIYDGSSRAAGLKLYLNGQEIPTEILRDEMIKQANVKVDHGGLFVLGQRFRARGLDGGLIDDARLYKRELTPTEINHLATDIRFCHRRNTKSLPSTKNAAPLATR